MIDHTQVVAKGSVEQYLLGELKGPEREEFEEHVFSCAECAEDLKSGALFIANARAVFNEEASARRGAETSLPKRWFEFEWLNWRFAPAAVAAGCSVLLAVVLSQHLIQVPGPAGKAKVEDEGRTQVAMLPPLRVRVTRGKADATETSKKMGDRWFLIRREWPESYVRYECELETPDKRIRKLKIEAEIEGEDLKILIPASQLPTGSHVLNVDGIGQDSVKKRVAPVRFTVTE